MLTDHIPHAHSGFEYAIEYQLMISTSGTHDSILPYGGWPQSSLILMVDAAYPFVVVSETAADQTIVRDAGEFIKNLTIQSLLELFPSIPEGTELDQLIGVRTRINKFDSPSGDVIESVIIDYLKTAGWAPVLISVDQENA